MRKSSNSKSHYRPGTSRGGLSLVTFREQMNDFARGDILLDLRAGKRMSRENVAHAIGVSTKSVYTWEKKSGAIKAEHAKKLAKFYGVKDWEELVTRDPEATGPSSRGQVGEGFVEFRTHVNNIRMDIAELKGLLKEARSERGRIEKAITTQQGILEEIKRVAAGLPNNEALERNTEAAELVRKAAQAVEARAQAAEESLAASEGTAPGTRRQGAGRR
jgi:transcriptional regulator with XRE-family HTH domain